MKLFKKRKIQGLNNGRKILENIRNCENAWSNQKNDLLLDKRWKTTIYKDRWINKDQATRLG